MSNLAFVLASTAGVESTELPAHDRQVRFRLDDPCDASWSMSGRHPKAASIAELASDLVVYLDGRKVLRARVGGSNDDITEDTHSCRFSAVDYRGVLGRRIALEDLSFTSEDQFDIAWQIVEHAQDSGTYPSELGITRGVGDESGVDRDYEVPAGANLGEAIAALGRMENGFEWQVSPELKFDQWSPQRGSLKADFVAEFGSTVSAVQRAVDTSQYATLVRQTGARGTDEDPGPTPVVAASADLASRPEGRWDLSVGNPDLTGDLADAAAGQLALSERLLPSYTVTFRPGAWRPDLLWLGDACPLAIDSGRLHVVPDLGDPSTWQRVIQLHLAEPDDGGLRVQATFGRPSLDLFRSERDLVSRVTRLERR